MIYALDSNIISYMMRGDELVRSRYNNAVAGGNRCAIPLIVYYEVRRGLLANDAGRRLLLFKELCDKLIVSNLAIADMDIAAKIYADRTRRGMPIDDADLLIAAQAVSRGYILVTNNIRHFEGVAGLRLANWAE